jgi:hypothetical protein
MPLPACLPACGAYGLVQVTAQEISGFDEKDGPKPPMPDMRPVSSSHSDVAPLPHRCMPHTALAAA